MYPQLLQLLDAIRQVEDGPPGDLVKFIQECPKPGEFPTPWESWTLIGLIRHRTRQLWVQEIIKTRLSGDIETISVLGALGHPTEIAPSGSVPGMPEWEYDFHGRGCCLTHVTSERIDVDFLDNSAEYFDFYFYTAYLKSLAIRKCQNGDSLSFTLHSGLYEFPLKI